MDIVTVPARQALQSSLTGATSPVDGDLVGTVVVRVSGEIDLYTGPRLRETLRDLLPPLQPTTTPTAGDRGTAKTLTVHAVVVDLSEVTFMDSYALGVLVQGHHLARPGGRAYAVVATQTTIHDLFRMTGPSRVLPLHPDVATAVRELHPANGEAAVRGSAGNG